MNAPPLITLEQVRGEILKRSLYKFVCEFWDEVVADPMKDNWHIKAICDEIQTVFMKVIHREDAVCDLSINIPPGTSKSTIVSIMAPAWGWANAPWIRFITASYSSKLATGFAVKSRNIIESPKYKNYFPNVVLQADANNKTDYQTTKNGQRVVASPSSGVTGIHAHITIIDDGLSADQAQSEAYRKACEEFITQTLSTRKADKKISVMIAINQRLHMADVTAVMMKRGVPTKQIVLPARLSDKDGAAANVVPAYYAQFYINGLLDAVRLDEGALSKLEKELGSYGTSGQLQQRPTPQEGAMWKRSYFIAVPDHEFPTPDKMLNYGTDWDTAYTKKQVNDASGYCISGKIGPNIYIDKVGAVRLEMPALVRFMSTLPDPHYIEKKASGQSAAQTLHEHHVVAIEVNVRGGDDKIARTTLATPTGEAGMIYVRASVLPYLLDDHEQGLLFFPAGIHDDVNDAVTQAISRHRNTRSWI